MSGNSVIQDILTEVKKAVVGKDQVLAKVLLAILARGHILLEDIPGVGKTTMALAFSRALSLQYNRVQFTPDVMPSDITGFSMLNKETGKMEYQPGAVLCNLFLADELNRATSRTQSALLEAMEEGQVTVDGVSHKLPVPYTVIATQNPVGSAGTQLLPESQLDRFMVRLSLGYPSLEQEVEILRQTEGERPVDGLQPVVSLADVADMQRQVGRVHVADDIYRYVAQLCAATREHALVRLGASPRAGGALVRICRASAWMAGRDFVIPGDVQLLFFDVLEHRITLDPQARLGDKDAHAVLAEVLKTVAAPRLVR